MSRLLAKKICSKILTIQRKFGSTPLKNQILKVSILGASGHCGQTTSLLLKLCPYIQELALYDVEPTNGIANELNLIDTDCKVVSYPGKIKEALLVHTYHFNLTTVSLYLL